MPWPLSQDYNEALQNPQSSFSDAELRQGQVVVNALGIPQPCSGNFADVYAVECPTSKTKWAVKCFTREVHGLRERYSEISNYLQRARLPFTVDFQYVEQGIRITGRWYPILKMHWVEGYTLNAFVRDMLDKPAMLEKLSRIWVRMAHRLREAKLTHCDLQHGNVLLVPDSTASALAVKLIDYDGMWVPALAKSPSGEFGHPAFQHPRRLHDNIYNAEVDRFPLLAVHLALRALISGGRQLWQRYDTGDNLLFRQSDFEAPAKSPLFAELLRMKQPELRDLAVKLIDAARLPLERTPHLAELVADEKPAKSSVSRSPLSAASRWWNAAATRTQPAAQTEEVDPFQDFAPQQTTPPRGGSVVGWIAAGAVAACAVVGGALLWGLQPKRNSDKPVAVPELVQHKSTAAAPAPMELDLPRPSPKPNGNSGVPAGTPVSIPDGPPGEVQLFEGMAGVYNIAFSPDGHHFLTAHNDGSLHLWATVTGREIRVLRGHTDVVWSAVFSPDGKRAVSASSDKTVRLWDLETAKQIRAFTGHSGMVAHAVFSPDGRQVISGSEDSTVRLWDIESGREIRSYQGHLGAVYQVAFAPDGARVVSGGFDQLLHLWDKETGKELPPCKGGAAHVYRLAFSSDGQLIAAGGAEKEVRIWRIANRSLLHTLTGHSGPVIGLSFSPDGHQLVSITKGGEAQVWDVATGEELGRYYGPQDTGMDAAVISSDGRYFLTAGADKMVRLWRLPAPDVLAAKPNDPVGEAQTFTGHTANVRRVTFSFDGRHILSAGYDNTARLWETATGREVLAYRKHTHSDVTTVAFLPDGLHALSGGVDRVLRLWTLRDGREIRTLKGFSGSVFNSAVSPDGRRSVSCGQMTDVVIWNLERGEENHRLKGLGVYGDRVCFSPDGQSVLVGHDEGSLCLLDAANGQIIRRFQGHSNAVTGIGFSPDGRQVFSASRDKTVRLWDAASGKELRRYEGSTDQLEGAVLSPDGRRIVAGGRDKVLRLWDVQTGAKIANFNGPALMWDVAYSPDGRYAVSAGNDKTLRLWRLPFARFVFGRPLQIKAEETVVQNKPPAPVNTATPDPAAGKLPVPDEAAQKKATEDVRDIYKTDYAALHQPNERIALAIKLLKRGRNEGEEPTRRFAYLSEARDLAARGGDAVVSLSAIDELAKMFAVEAAALKAAALELAVKAPQNLDSVKKLLGQTMIAVDEAESADEYEREARLLKIARSAALKTSDRFLLEVVARRENRLKDLRADYAKIVDAVRTLAGKPDDPAANLSLGEFECFEKENWSKGLPMLARGQDTTLAEVARKEMENPLGANEQAALGQAWRSFADKQNNASIKKAARQRARHWLRLALPYVDGAQADRISSQLELSVGRLKLRPGLVAELFRDEKFEKKVAARLDYKVDANWGEASPDKKMRKDHFSIRWQGWLIPPRAGKYKLIVTHDDGIRLILNGKTVIDKWGQVGDPTTAEIALLAQPYALQLDYHEIIGSARSQLRWSLDFGFEEQIIPLDVLYHDIKQERLLTP